MSAEIRAARLRGRFSNRTASITSAVPMAALVMECPLGKLNPVSSTSQRISGRRREKMCFRTVLIPAAAAADAVTGIAARRVGGRKSNSRQITTTVGGLQRKVTARAAAVSPGDMPAITNECRKASTSPVSPVCTQTATKAKAISAVMTDISWIFCLESVFKPLK